MISKKYGNLTFSDLFLLMENTACAGTYLMLDIQEDFLISIAIKLRSLSPLGTHRQKGDLF